MVECNRACNIRRGFVCVCVCFCVCVCVCVSEREDGLCLLTHPWQISYPKPPEGHTQGRGSSNQELCQIEEEEGEGEGPGRVIQEREGG
jgi:hypothetical protein